MNATYYNEIDPGAASWLRELIKAGAIPDGEVDTRSITAVAPADLRGFHQCHFFAGIGGWAYALQLAGWPDSRGVWTGSCPCQPFSSAGAGKGAADPRHLWPVWAKLIAQCRPPVVFGEQVEAAIAHGWLDLVQADLEGEGYAFGWAGLPAAGVGAPHIRGRVWFVADTGRGADERCGGPGEASGATGSAGGEVEQRERRGVAAGAGGASGERLAHPQRDPRGPGRLAGQPREGAGAAGAGAPVESGRCGDLGKLGHPHHPRLPQRERDGGVQPETLGTPEGEAVERGGDSGFWSDVEWLPCRDGKARPTQRGIFPLASGVPNRVVLLRGAGNSIVPQVAEAFIRAYLEC